MEKDLGKMTFTEGRKGQLLVILILLLCASILYQFPGKTNSTVGIVRRISRDSFTKAKARGLLDTVLLSKELPTFVHEKRNIFQFKANASAEDSTQAVTWLKAQLPITPEPVVPDVHYLGFYLEKDKPTVKLAAISNSGRIYVGKVGDVLGGKYAVLQIEKAFVLLRLVAEDKVIRLPLGKRTGVFVKMDSSADEKDSEEE